MGVLFMPWAYTNLFLFNWETSNSANGKFKAGSNPSQEQTSTKQNRVNFLSWRNHESLWWRSNSQLTSIHQVWVRCANHITMRCLSLFLCNKNLNLLVNFQEKIFHKYLSCNGLFKFSCITLYIRTLLDKQTICN